MGFSRFTQSCHVTGHWSVLDGRVFQKNCEVTAVHAAGILGLVPDKNTDFHTRTDSIA